MVDVPNVPGVPSLANYSADVPQLLIADAVSFLANAIGILWAIIPVGASLPLTISTPIIYHSIVDFDYKQDWPISDYPVEDGAFLSYDKVQLPYDVKLRLTSGGTSIERRALLVSVQLAANSLGLYTVVTPEQIYPNCCITHVDYRQASQNGLGMIVIDIWFVQIRVTSTSVFSNTQSPAIAGQNANGLVSAQDPSTSVSSRVSTAGGAQ